MGLQEFYKGANDSFGRHGIAWALLLFVLPGVSIGALAAYLATTLDWFWRTWGLLGIFFVVLLTWILLGLGLLIVRALFNPRWLRTRPHTEAGIPGPPPKSFDWQLPVDAMREFDPIIDGEFIEANRCLTLAANAVSEAAAKVPKNPAEVYGYGITVAGNKDVSPERQALNEAETIRRSLEQARNDLFARQRRNFITALEKGEFVAQGYLGPIAPGTPPVDIPKEEWRLLNFAWGDIAMHRARIPDGPEYRAIRVAKNPP